MPIKITSEHLKSYDDFVKDLHSAGYNTTSVNSAKDEANFADYGFALGDNVKEMITSSFDCDADYELQSRIASVFGKRSVLQNNDFAAACRNIGLKVERFSTNTQYMIDEKNTAASGGYGARKVTNGGISMFKISDGNGGEIIIADANGNAALEIEEVFMNQILNEISVDVEQLQSNYNNGTNAYHGGSSSVSASSSLSEEENKDNKKVSQTDFNSKVEAYKTSNGVTIKEAEQQVIAELGLYNMSYTGTMEDKEEAEEENIFADSTK